MIWSSILTVMGITGLWLAGSGKKAGWLVGLIAQILWIGYALVTKQYPFIVSALVYGFVYMRNYNKSLPTKQVQIAGDGAIQIQASDELDYEFLISRNRRGPSNINFGVKNKTEENGL